MEQTQTMPTNPQFGELYLAFILFLYFIGKSLPWGIQRYNDD